MSVEAYICTTQRNPWILANKINHEKKQDVQCKLVFNLVWALPLDTGQKIWKVNVGESLYFGACCLNCQLLLDLMSLFFYNSGPLTWFYIYFKWLICNFTNLIFQWLNIRECGSHICPIL